MNDKKMLRNIFSVFTETNNYLSDENMMLTFECKNGMKYCFTGESNCCFEFSDTLVMINYEVEISLEDRDLENNKLALINLNEILFIILSPDV